ncbi:tautomerase family protein [Pseudopelagicola sp. nBUS_19]|uniref:tautomerase family protein n=1 Tax=Pseudopelagicola sp. nBUS_19 TaxID=3395316 RepID=UPI003EBCCC40
MLHQKASISIFHISIIFLERYDICITHNTGFSEGVEMPIVELHVLNGYDIEEKQRLGDALTNAVRFVVPAAPELVTVMIHDMPAEDYYRGGKSRIPARALPDPIAIVKNFLVAMEARKLEVARDLLANNFEMTFPGGVVMHRLEELIVWAQPRYKFVTKTYDGFDAMQSNGDAAVVFARGTLQGEYLDGSSFESVRFIDRFEMINGKIVKQEVWNDMAEIRMQP